MRVAAGVRNDLRFYESALETNYRHLSGGGRAADMSGLFDVASVRENFTNLLNDAHETFGTFARNPRAAGAPVEPFLTPSPPIHVDVGVAYRF